MAKTTAPAKDTFVRNPVVGLREENQDGALLFNADTNQTHVINATGLFIWRRCDGASDVPAIVAAIEQAFEDVPQAEVTAEVEAFIASMRAIGFLVAPEAKA